ncbi:MAG: hypothetical protein IH814_00305 [Thaumarchaeota archaeon]|nr:hypothetical protein [Nitrososphaerota archaeon]
MAMKTVTVKKKASEIIAIAGMGLLLTYIFDAAVGQGETGFLPISEKERGTIFGFSTIILFFAAFGIGFNEKSAITTILLIMGGALIGTSVLGASLMAEGGLTSISNSFIGIIIAGYIIMGLGILRAVKKK